MPDNDIRSCALPMLGLRFTLSAPMTGLPEFPGGVLHGAFGKALRDVDPNANAILLGSIDCVSSESTVWPCRMIVSPPPLGRLVVEVLLYGLATRFATAVILAMDCLALSGLGRARSPLRVLQVEFRNPDGSYVEVIRGDRDPAVPAALTLAEIAHSDIPVQAERLVVRLLSPLRLKQDNRLVSTPPSYECLFLRLAQRVRDLARNAGHGLDFPADLRALAAEVPLVRADTQWYEFSRYSARQKSAMRFGGLVGELVYRGRIGPFIPWLQAAEWLGVGGKTTFGLGNISVDYG